jgi:hypothetical protein
MNYNKSATVTYAYYDKKLRNYVFDKNFDLEDVEEFEDLAEDIYRCELLIAFNIDSIDDFNTEKVLETFPKLLDLIPDNPFILFSYDFFFFTHQCIVENFQETIVSDLKHYINEFNKLK